MGDSNRSDSSPSPDSAEEVPLEAIPLHSTNLLTLLDENGIIRYESPSIERILGYGPDDLVGEQVAAYFHPEDREHVADAFQMVVESEADTIRAAEYRHEQADGTYCWVESVTSANPTPEGYYVINTRDVSDRKPREQALEATNERLDAFAMVVSHDLQSPLSVASGRLRLAAEECNSEHLVEVARAHERMETLLEDLLTLARGGRQLDAVEPVDLATLCATCWQTTATAEATLEIDIDRTVEADRSRLQQLLENLLRNAVVHTGGDVTITVGELPGGTGFYVADDGPGIDVDRRDQIFESGYTTSDDGTGFGLTIATEIAEAHGWDLSVTDSSGGGTKFELRGVDFR